MNAWEGERKNPLFVLIVDDDEVSREVVGALLEGRGYSISSAASAQSALDQLSTLAPNRLPDIILTDLQMPHLAGNDFARRLRAVCGSAVKLLVMTAGDPEGSTIAEYDSFVRKPIQLDEFARAIKGCCLPVKTVEPNSSEMLAEATYGKLVEAMGHQRMTELYRLCLADVCQRIDRIRSGVDTQNLEGQTGEAHSLQGSCGMVGALEMWTLATVLERALSENRTRLELEVLLDELAAACARLRSMLEARWRENA